MNPTELMDKVLAIMNSHLDQIRIQATHMTKDGARGFSDSNAGVVDKYAKILLAMSKQAPEDLDETDRMSDDEMIAEAAKILEANKKEEDNATETSDTE